MNPSCASPCGRFTSISRAPARVSLGSSGSTHSVSSEVLPSASVAVARTFGRSGVPAHAHSPAASAVVVPSYTSA